MRKRSDTGDSYLQMYPGLRKWINQCAVCQTRGRKPEMPEHISREHSVATEHIKRYFSPLHVNELNICDQCAKAIQRTK